MSYMKESGSFYVNYQRKKREKTFDSYRCDYFYKNYLLMLIDT